MLNVFDPSLSIVRIPRRKVYFRVDRRKKSPCTSALNQNILLANDGISTVITYLNDDKTLSPKC